MLSIWNEKEGNYKISDNIQYNIKHSIVIDIIGAVSVDILSATMWNDL